MALVLFWFYFNGTFGKMNDVGLALANPLTRPLTSVSPCSAITFQVYLILRVHVGFGCRLFSCPLFTELRYNLVYELGLLPNCKV
jgi:hypothetical protein